MSDANFTAALPRAVAAEAARTRRGLLNGLDATDARVSALRSRTAPVKRQNAPTSRRLQ